MKNVMMMVLVCGLLTACGVKPGSVDPPGGAEPDPFPRDYPDITTDPPPRRGPGI